VITLNGQPRSLPAGGTIADVVRELAGPDGWRGSDSRCGPGAGPGGAGQGGVAVAVNDEVVPRRVWSATALADGDRVEVLTAVQGG
jgi:sulfur carrier protein